MNILQRGIQYLKDLVSIDDKKPVATKVVAKKKLANTQPIIIPDTSPIPVQAFNVVKAKPMATLYGPGNIKETVYVGSFRAKELQTKGWGLTANSYKPTTKLAIPVQEKRPVNAQPFNVGTGKFSEPIKAKIVNPFTAPKQEIKERVTLKTQPEIISKNLALEKTTPTVSPKFGKAQITSTSGEGSIPEILYAITRPGASVGLDLATTLSKLKVPGMTEETQLSINKDAPKWQQTIQRIIFGTEPIDSMSKQIADAELKYPGLPKGLIFAGVVGMNSLNFTGVGSEANAIKSLAKETDELAVKGILNKIGLSDDVAEKLAPKFAKETDEKVINGWLNNIKELNETAKNKAISLPQKLNINEVSKATNAITDGIEIKPGAVNRAIQEGGLIQEARKYKSAEEFVKAQGTPVYHGTSEKFEKFDNAKIGSTQGFNEPGFSFTDTIDGAKVYSSTYPQKSKYKWTEADKLNAEKANVIESFFNKDDALTLQDLVELYKSGKIKTKPITEGLFRPESVADNNRIAIKEAFDITGKNVFKATMEGQTNYIVKDASLIKTKSQLIDIWNKSQPIQEARKGASYTHPITEKTHTVGDIVEWNNMYGAKKVEIVGFTEPNALGNVYAKMKLLENIDLANGKTYKKGMIMETDPRNLSESIKSQPLQEGGLIQEARKYKSAEEFVSQKLNADTPKIYDEMLGSKVIKTPNDSVRFTLKETPEEIKLFKILADKPGTGEGTKFIEALKEYSDKTGKKFIVIQPNKFWDKFNYFTKRGGRDIEYIPKSQPIQEVNPLIQEARKYKSAEEFVRAQGTPVYHGTSEKTLNILDIEKSNDGNLGRGIYLTSDSNVAKEYGKIKIEHNMMKSGNYTGKIPDGNTVEVVIDKNAKIKMLDHQPSYLEAEKIKKEGYDGISYPDESMMVYQGGRRILEDSTATVIYNKNIIKTKSQLIDIWNKSQPLQEGGLIQEARKVNKDIRTLTIKTADGKNEYVAQIGDNVKDRVGRNTGGFKSQKTSPNFKTQGEADKWIKENIKGLGEKTVSKSQPLQEGGLIQEARKYKSAEEFVKSQEIPVEDVTSFYKENLGNIVSKSFNLDRLGLNDNQKNVVKTIIDNNTEELGAAKGDILKLNDVIKRAEKESEILSDIISRDETLQRAANELSTRQEITRLGKIVEDSGTDLATKKQATERMIELLKIDASDAADVARRLGSRRTVAEDVGIAENMTKRLLALGNKADDVAKKAANVNWQNDNEVVNFWRSFVKPSSYDILTEMRYNNMLSNPRTFARNLTSNIVQALITRPLVKAVSAVIDTFIAPLTGKEREIFLKEVPKYYYGLIKNIPKAFEDFGKVWGGNVGILQQDLQRMPTGKLPKAWRIPSLALEGTDVFLRRLIGGGEMAAGKTEKEAMRIAEYSLFRSGLDTTNKTGQGKLLSFVDNVTSKIDGLRDIKGVNWFIPFLRTPMNFAKMWIEYSPAGMLNLIGSTRKKEQIAKMMIGSAISAYGAKLAWDGKTTWGTPTDPEARDLFFASGKKPFSVLIGDKYVPMMYLGPWAMALAIPAAIKYYKDESPTALTDDTVDKIGKISMSMAEFFSQQTFMQGLGNFVNLFKGSPDVSIEKNLAFTAGQIIPMQGLLRYVATVVDPVFRKSDGFVESLQSGIPFLSKELQAYKDPSGIESKRNWTDYFAPYSAGQKQEQFNEIFNVREKELQSNALFNELNKKDKEEAISVVENLGNAVTDEDVINAMTPLKNNAGLKKAVKLMLKKQAEYQSAKLEPYRILDTTSRAEYVYTALLMAKIGGKEKEDELVELMKELNEQGLFGEKERKALKSILKEYPIEDEKNTSEKSSE